MRVVAGKFRSRQLATFSGAEIRPTSDRLRETLFDVLAAQGSLAGTRWLDLFAGTGAVGIEALSRGAKEVYFVEAARASVALIRKNLETLNIGNGSHVITSKTLPALRKLATGGSTQFDFCFIDPPYQMEEQYALTLNELSASPLLAPGAVVIAEHSKHFDLAGKFGDLQRYRRLQQGDAVLSFFQIS